MNPKYSAHLYVAKESYWFHAKQAFLFAGTLFKLALAVGCHALFPWLYQDKASNDIRRIGFGLSKRREKTIS